MALMMTTITIIEDNKELAHGLESNLLIEGYQVTLCHDGAKAMNHILQHQPDLVILDMMLPHVDGFEIIKQLGQQQIHTPVLCLTARSTEMDKVRALRSGADDYLTKPFGLMELLARVEALLRRNPSRTNDDDQATVALGHLIINITAQQVMYLSKAINLTPKEYQLLLFFSQNPGRVVSRVEIMREVWGHQAAINSRTVDTHIAELRKKCLLDGRQTTQITTVPKAGYLLQNA